MHKAKKTGRPKTVKETITVRLLPETKAKLKRAVAASGEKNKSVYIEKMLLDRFKQGDVE
jgi:hypothetical protein